MASETSICNLALSWLAGDPITSLDDDTNEAKLCKANYELARDAVLEDRAWTFATRRYVWTPMLDTPAYGYANQFLIDPEVLRILEVRNTDDPNQANGYSHLDWRREENHILTNVDIIYVKAVYREVDVNRYTSSFIQCLAARIAADIAIPLTESRSILQDMWSLYQQKLADAAATDGMQGTTDIIQSRNLIDVR